MTTAVITQVTTHAKQAHDAVLVALGQVDTSPQQPPGLGKFMTLIHWTSWGVGIVAVIAFLISLGIIAVGALRGDAMTGMKGAGIAAGVCAVVGTSGVLLGALT